MVKTKEKKRKVYYAREKIINSLKYREENSDRSADLHRLKAASYKIVLQSAQAGMWHSSTRYNQGGLLSFCNKVYNIPFSWFASSAGSVKLSSLSLIFFSVSRICSFMFFSCSVYYQNQIHIRHFYNAHNASCLYYKVVLDFCFMRNVLGRFLQTIYFFYIHSSSFLESQFNINKHFSFTREMHVTQEKTRKFGNFT